MRPASFLSIKVLRWTHWKDVTKHYMDDSNATKIPNLLSQSLLNSNTLSPYLSWISFCLGENRTSLSSHKAPFCNTLGATSQSMHILAVRMKNNTSILVVLSTVFSRFSTLYRMYTFLISSCQHWGSKWQTERCFVTLYLCRGVLCRRREIMLGFWKTGSLNMQVKIRWLFT